MGHRRAHVLFIRDARVPVDIARRLVGLGHVECVRSRAAHGDQWCAVVLAGHDPDDRALDRFTDEGWWPVLRARAAALHRRGRIGDALTLLRPWTSDALVVREVAGLLAAQGRTDEVFALLVPRNGEPGLAAALVEFAAAAGRGAEAVAALTPFAATSCRVAMVVAADLERRGDVDAAVAVLRPHGVFVVGYEEQLLRRHGRTPDPVDPGDPSDPEDDVDLFLAHVETLVERGRIEDAIAELRDRPDLDEPLLVGRLAELLAGQGRDTEAIETLTAPATLANATLLAKLMLRARGQGRVQDALDVLDRYHDVRVPR